MIRRLKGLIKNIHRPTNRIKVYALVGSSGTGKSFRARLIAEKYQIDLMVDDGLLIRGQQILAGQSAKRESNRFKAVKRAILEDTEHAQSIRKALDAEKFSSILIIGTSEKMVARIAEQLELPYPDQVIYIEDVSTTEEIAMAQEHRKTQGKHIIPVPVVEVKKDPGHRVLDSIRFFIERHPVLFWKKQIIEKTIVQPPFSRIGKISISEVALSQMIMHCVEEYDPNIKIQKIIIDDYHRDYSIEVILSIQYGLKMGLALSELQNYIVQWVQRYSGIHIKRLDFTVDQVLHDIDGS
ncbi:hypothetical protein JW835_11765 [bacterium]|nr:hypothetical protein [bacterium]